MLTSATGWYLYGITRSGAPSEILVGIGDAADEAQPLQLLEYERVAAVVRPVRLPDAQATVMRERLRNSSELESLVWSHNRVVDAVHAQQAMLPAKFGMVYTRDADIVSALRSGQDALLSRLDRLEGCDEWAIHLYASPAVFRERVAASDPEIRQLRDECAACSPGRAYFRERQLHDRLELATQQALQTQAQEVFDRLMEDAVAGHVNPIATAEDAVSEAEVLRATFLVARHLTERFQSTARRACTSAGLRSEASGPWPPYSFAAFQGEEVS